MGMQGWRRTQEDAHIAHINLEPQGNHLFGVFDGHGGKLTHSSLEMMTFMSGCRPRSSAVRQKTFREGAHQAAQLQEQVLQRSPGGGLPKDGRIDGDKEWKRGASCLPEGLVCRECKEFRWLHRHCGAHNQDGDHLRQRRRLAHCAFKEWYCCRAILGPQARRCE